MKESVNSSELLLWIYDLFIHSFTPQIFIESLLAVSTVQSALHILCSSFLTIILWVKYYFYPNFRDEEVGA